MKFSSARSRILCAVVASMAVAGGLLAPGGRNVMAAPPNDDVADWVFGGPSGFTTSTCNGIAAPGGLTSATFLCSTQGVAWDTAGNLYVSDGANNRVLEYDSPLTSDIFPDRVFGQPDFTSNACGVASATTLCAPEEVAIGPTGTLYVVDRTRARVLYYNNPLTTDAVADGVYGQPNLTTAGCTGIYTASSLCVPQGVAVDNSGNVFISDATRVLAYLASPFDHVADRVYGQPNFTSNGANNGGLSASSLYDPFGLTVDSAGRLFVADPHNQRIVVYENPLTSDSVADHVVGQVNFTSNVSCYSPGPISASNLCLPGDVAVDANGTLYVGDVLRSGVLIYYNVLTSDKVADRIIGQPGFTTDICYPGGISAATLCSPRALALTQDGTLAIAGGGVRVYFAPSIGDLVADRILGEPTGWTNSSCNAGGRSAASLCSPSGVAVDPAGNVYIADSLNHRVLGYASPLTTDMVADIVFGQSGNFTTATTSFPPNANTMAFPYAVAADSSGNLYVADTDNARVLVFNTPFSSDTVPDTVIGQPNFTTGTCNTGGRSASTLCSPTSVTLDGSGNLFLADYDNGRILEYNTPLASDAIADRVFGKTNFTTSGCNNNGVNASSLCEPYGIAFDAAGSMFVADRSNNRVLRYDAPLTDAVADGLTGQPDFSTQGCNNFQPVDVDAICWPIGVASDGAQVYIADNGNDRITRATGVGIPVQVFGQLGSFTTNSPNTGGESARTLDGVRHIATDNAGRLYAADYDNSRVLVYNTGADTDTDLVTNSVDNCATVANPSQTNSDANFIDNPPTLTQDDGSRAMSDVAGNACDTDADNDGLVDALEIALPGAACASATAPLSPINPDSDNDAHIDWAECAIGTNPNLASSKPTGEQCRMLAGAASQATDTDGDKVADRVERCGYFTASVSVDSDGDGRRDQCEVASLNTLPALNSLDQLLLAQAIIADLGGPYVWNADLNKDGANNSADQLLMAQIILSLSC